MIKSKIKLLTIDDVKEFINLMMRMPARTDLSSDGYIVDAASLLGVMMLNHNKPVELIIHCEEIPGFLRNNLKKFEVTE